MVEVVIAASTVAANANNPNVLQPLINVTTQLSVTLEVCHDKGRDYPKNH